VPKKPLKPEAKPDLVYEIEGAPPALFVIHSIGSDAWVTRDGTGWSTEFLNAGTFSEARAKELAAEHQVITPLSEVVRARAVGANPVVLAAIAALGGR
jgi:hypothetical protein